jgi:RHS repeat-associated protein
VIEPPSAPAPAPAPTPDALVASGAGPGAAARLVPTRVRAVTPPTVAALHAQAVARAARPAMPSGSHLHFGRGLTLVANADAADARRTPAATTPDGATTAVTWTASVVGTGTGTVSSSPAGLACGGTDVSCAGLFAEGTAVTFTATPASGHAFTGWAGACTGTSTTCEVFIVGAQTVVATFTGPPTLTYYHLDVLGSVRAITDAEGDPVTRHDYAPFGESTSDLDGDSRRFTGQQLDAETALDYHNARYYRNVWGRFTTADESIYMDPAEPQSFNLYAYVFNNPLRWVDPSGHSAQDPQHTTTETTPLPVFRATTWGCTWGCGVNVLEMRAEGLDLFQMGPRSLTGQRLRPRLELGLSDRNLEILGAAIDIASLIPMLGALRSVGAIGKGAFTAISNVTLRGARTTNLAVDLTASEFMGNLMARGYRVVPSRGATVLTDGRKTYSIYTARSTGTASAEVRGPAGELLGKLRLSGY